MPARYHFLFACAACVALLATISAPARAAERKEFFLKYRLSANAAEEVGAGGQRLELVSAQEKHDVFKSLPMLKEEPNYQASPLYATFKLGVKNQEVAIVLDSSSGGKLDYDLLYVDADSDGRITAAEGLTGEPRDRGIAFGPIKLLVDYGDEKCLQWFRFHLSEYEYQGQVRRSLSVVNSGYYQGVVTFGNQKWLLAVVDANGNGLYNDCMKGTNWNADRLLIDINNDGKLDGSYQSEEAQPLGCCVLVGDKYWKLEVAADGSSVFLEPLDKPQGRIRSEQREYSVLLTGNEGVIRVRSEDGTAGVPEGEYRLAQGLYQRAGKEGKRWQFSIFHAKDGPIVNVVANQTVLLPLGPPFVPKVLVTQSGDELSLTLSLCGAGGEVYRDVTIGAVERPPVPKVRIIDASGRELAILDFHYG